MRITEVVREVITRGDTLVIPPPVLRETLTPPCASLIAKRDAVTEEVSLVIGGFERTENGMSPLDVPLITNE